MTSQPAYRRVADELRRQIAAGRLREGEPLPSARQLMATHGVSITVVRAAVNELRAAGLVIGQPGKGVFVQNADRASQAPSLADQVEDLAAEVRELRERLERLESSS